MLAAVGVEAAGYEGLRNYILGGGRPTDVRGFDQSGVRQALGVPNGPQPGVQTPIPTSSARPGKMTNQRIVYSRVQTQFATDCGSIASVPVVEGDVVFVHRHDGQNTQGHDHARTSRIASIGQLNSMLGSYGGSPLDRGDIVMMAGDPDNPNDPRGILDAESPTERWKHCRALGKWVPDGVLASKEHDCVQDVSNPGAVFNVAIGGPTLIRNSSVGEFPQHFDDGVRALDKLFVGLIATEVRQVNDDGTYGIILYYSYRFKLFTSRQLLWTDFGPSNIAGRFGEPVAAGGDNRVAPTADEFARIVQVWRLGSIFDIKTGMMLYKCATINVVVEEWTLDAVRNEFNPNFGESLSLAPLEDRAVLEAGEIIRLAIAYAIANVGILTVTRETIGELWNPSFPSEVTAWETVDRSYEDDLSLVDLRDGSPPPEPKVGSVEGELSPEAGYNGQRLYKPASHGIEAFYTAYKDCLPCRRLFNDTLPDAAKDRATLGRAAALANNFKVVATLDPAVRQQLVPVLVAHRIMSTIGASMRLGARIKDGLDRWPVN